MSKTKLDTNRLNELRKEVLKVRHQVHNNAEDMRRIAEQYGDMMPELLQINEFMPNLQGQQRIGITLNEIFENGDLMRQLLTSLKRIVGQNRENEASQSNSASGAESKFAEDTRGFEQKESKRDTSYAYTPGERYDSKHSSRKEAGGGSPRAEPKNNSSRTPSPSFTQRTRSQEAPIAAFWLQVRHDIERNNYFQGGNQGAVYDKLYEYINHDFDNGRRKGSSMKDQFIEEIGPLYPRIDPVNPRRNQNSDPAVVKQLNDLYDDVGQHLATLKNNSKSR